MLTPPHPGSPAHRRSAENLIVATVRAAAGLGGPRPPSRHCALALLGACGEDFFEAEIESRVREGYECRTAADAAGYYAGRWDPLQPWACRWRNYLGEDGGDGCGDEPPPSAFAALHGDAGALRLLLQDAQVEALMAAGAGHGDCLRLLTCDLTGSLAAHLAAENGHAGCLGAIRGLGCDLGGSDADGATPAHLAAQHGHEVCLRALHGLGCDLDCADEDGATPAHLAADAGNRSCLETLLELGCDLGRENGFGETPADLVWYGGHVECMQALMAADGGLFDHHLEGG